MTITIYYSYLGETRRLPEPVNLLKMYMGGNAPDFMTDEGMGVPASCPAMREFYKNMFGIPSLWDYEVEIRDGKIYSNVRTKEFFDNAIYIRNEKMRGLSLNLSQIALIPDVDSLELIQYPPFLESTMQHANYFPGSFDIGKFPRVIDLALKFLSDTTWEIQTGDLMHYLKFNTKEKIKFVPFAFTPKMQSLMREVPARKAPANLLNIDGRVMPVGKQPEKGETCPFKFDGVWRKPRPLSWYYDIFKKSKIKKEMLAEAKRNIV